MKIIPDTIEGPIMRPVGNTLSNETKRDDSVELSRFFVLLILGLLIGGCSGAFGFMDQTMNSWKGATLNEVITQWGYPTIQQEIAGRKLYIWDKNSTFTLPSTTTGTANVVGNMYRVHGRSRNWAKL